MKAERSEYVYSQNEKNVIVVVNSKRKQKLLYTWFVGVSGMKVGNESLRVFKFSSREP